MSAEVTFQRQGGPGVIAVSVITSADDDAAREVARQVLGVADVGTDEIETARDDSADLAHEVFGHLEEANRKGLRGDSIIGVGPDTDLLEFALVLEALFEERASSETLLILRDLITISSVREILAFFDRIGSSPAAGNPDFTGAELLVTRLEMATTIVLSDLEASTPDDAGAVVALLGALNPNAKLMGRVGLLRPDRRAPGLVRSLAQRLAASSGWQRALAGELVPAAVSRASRMVVFRDPRPFHPGRLAAAIEDGLAGSQIGRVQRSKGLFRLASRADRIGMWSSVGDALSLDPTSMLSWDVDSPTGQELVFFGDALDAAALSELLLSCLLTTEELLEGPAVWVTYSDPFPEWVFEHEH